MFVPSGAARHAHDFARNIHSAAATPRARRSSMVRPEATCTKNETAGFDREAGL